VSHTLAVVNGMFFDSKTMSDSHARRIVDLLPEHTDLVAVCEMGKSIRSTFGKALNRNRGGRWSRKGAADGMGHEGVNGIFWDRRVWDFPDAGRVRYKTLASGGQWPRFLVAVRLVEVEEPGEFLQAGAFHLAAKGSPLSATQADRVKRVQTDQLGDFMGDRRIIMGGDFPRTGDDDDLAALKRNGYRVNGRTDRTPLVSISHGAITVTGTRIVESGSLLDHDIHTTTFSLPRKALA